MGHARAAEYRIVRDLIRRREGRSLQAPDRAAETVIRVLAGTAGLLLLGSLVPELLWAALAASVVFALGTR